MQLSRPLSRRQGAPASVASRLGAVSLAALLGGLQLDPLTARAGETTVVTRISCAPEVAEDVAREPKERMYDYRRYQEVAFASGREVRCFAAGDYAPEPVLDAVRDRSLAALRSLGAPETAAPSFLAFWQRPPDEDVPAADVTRVAIELSACVRPATEPRWVCRATVRAWYFKPGMSREGVLYDLTVLSTFDPALHTDAYAFAPALSLAEVPRRGKPPMDTAMVFP